MRETPPWIDRPTGPHFADEAIWLAGVDESDVQLGFRSDLELSRSTEVTIGIQAASSFRLWVDGRLVVAGPLRFAAALPEYHTQVLRLAAGRHAFAVQVNGGGLTGRMLTGMPSFLWVRALDQNAQNLPLRWLARRFDEYAATGLRTSPLLDWVEWLDTPLDPAWRTAAPDDRWLPVSAVAALDVALGPATAGVVDLPSWPSVAVTELDRGVYRESFTGYRFDDPAAQFLLADRQPSPVDDCDGVWVCYDLGRVRIGSLEFTVVTEDDAEVTVGYADRLGPRGEIAPVVALSTGPTRMIQHFAVAAGSTRIEPFGALGARYVEVRVRTAGRVEIGDVAFRDRDFLGEPRGAFSCGDATLDRIWQVGLDTLRSCAEDGLIDSIRERGEWVGDVMASAIDLLAVGWGDQRLVHRALLHAAACARDDGLVAGCVPGEPIYVGTYAAQWLNVCVQAAQQQADPAILSELEEAGRKNVAALLGCVTDQGDSTLPWSFVDWGYPAVEDRPDPAVLLHVLRGLDAWLHWQELLHRPTDTETRRRRDQLRELLRTIIDTAGTPGYHVATLGYLAGLVELDVAVPIVREQLANGFPFDLGAARLRDPARVDASVVTPYFTNYSMLVLLDAGETDLVLDLWRQGWGWMLDQGATTWWEVFDDRWSQCHFWSGAPTWQLTRYLLGARLDVDDGHRLLDLSVTPGSLTRCEGTLPVGADQQLDISWQRVGDQISYTISSEQPYRLRTGTGTRLLEAGTTVLELGSTDQRTFRVG